MKGLNMKFLIAAISVCLSSLAAANPAPQMLDLLKKNHPNIPFTSVSTTPASGIFEVVIDKDVIYTESSGLYFFPTMVDMKNRVNLGDARKAELNKISFKDLPFDDSIKLVNGNGSRKMAVFSDPGCGFCKRLERNLNELKDVTIYVFPVAIMGAQSFTRTQSVMCATGNKANIWKAMMLTDANPVARSCESKSVENNTALFKQLGFEGTPSIVFENGLVARGFIENVRVEEFLARK